jgi:hypothetical protein
MHCALLILVVIMFLMLATGNMMGVDMQTFAWTGVFVSGLALYCAQMHKDLHGRCPIEQKSTVMSPQ